MFGDDLSRHFSIVFRGGIWTSNTLNSPPQLFVCWKHKHVLCVTDGFVAGKDCEGDLIRIVPWVKTQKAVNIHRVKKAIEKAIAEA